jgi:hypothetical protein
MLIRRIGAFFILIGAGLLLIFIVSTRAADGNSTTFLLTGLLCIAFGVFLRGRVPKPPPTPSNRFKILRKSNKKPQADEEETYYRNHSR